MRQCLKMFINISQPYKKKNASHIPKTLGLFSVSGISWEHNNEMYIIFNYTILWKNPTFLN